MEVGHIDKNHIFISRKNLSLVDEILVENCFFDIKQVNGLSMGLLRGTHNRSMDLYFLNISLKFVSLNIIQEI